MIYRYVDGEPRAELLERRWFAAQRAAQSVQAECEVLLGVLELAEESWRRARAQLTELETLRDALGEQLAAMDELADKSSDVPPSRDTAQRTVMTAA
jgi:hypothetical protein